MSIYFLKKALLSSREDRIGMIDKLLSLITSKQCDLLSIHRGRLYYKPVSKRDKISIDYAFSKKLLLFQDKTAALYTVLEGDVLAKVDTEQLLKCSKDDQTAKKLTFKPVIKINNPNELKALMGI
jgi:ADP-glucose pyrophosphorylase